MQIQQTELKQNEKKINLPHKFKPRPYQIPLLKALDNGVKRAVCVWHRGCGKDLCALNYLIKKAIQYPGVYLHCFPNFTQGKRAIWSSVHHTDEGEPISYLDHIPKELIRYKNSSEMTIQLVNGSIYTIMGIDGKNAQRARGMNPCFVILSEYAYMNPEAWQTIEPRINQNKGTAVFLSTPNGQNHFYDLYNTAKGNPDKYFSSLLTVDQTKDVAPDEIERSRREGTPEDFIQQEYYCSFTRGAQGSYYGKLIQQTRDEERIETLTIIPDLPVHTAWDKGVGDSTAIWIFQALRNGTYHFIEYYENHGEGIEHYLEFLSEWKKKHRIQWGVHFVPFDMENREFTSGVDSLEIARGFGYHLTVVPKKSLNEGVQAVRTIIPLSRFDKKRCERGVKCLDLYCKKWNDALKVYYDEPLHNQWSHGADAFRYACIGIKAIGFEDGKSLDSDYKALRAYWGE